MLTPLVLHMPWDPTQELTATMFFEMMSMLIGRTDAQQETIDLVLKPALKTALGDKKGTVTHETVYDSVLFTAKKAWYFTEDGQHSEEDMWGFCEVERLLP